MLYCPYLSSSLKQCSLIYYVSISLKRAVFAAMSNTGGKCDDWDSVKVAQRVAEGNSNQTESMVWAVHERDMSYLFFLCYYAKECRALCFCFLFLCLQLK